MLWHFRFQFSPAKGPPSQLGSSEADAEMGSGMLCIFRDQWSWIVHWGGHILSCREEDSASSSMKGGMPVLTRDVWATSAGFKVAEHYGVQNFEGTLPSWPHPKWRGPIVPTKFWSSSAWLGWVFSFSQVCLSIKLKSRPVFSFSHCRKWSVFMRDHRRPLAFTLVLHCLLITCPFSITFSRRVVSNGDPRVSSISIILELVKKYMFFDSTSDLLKQKIWIRPRNLCFANPPGHFELW